MAKKSRRRSGARGTLIDQALQDTHKKSVDDAIREQARMEPAHRHLQGLAREKVVACAQMWLAAIPDLGPMARATLERMVDMSMVAPLWDVTGERFRAHTVGHCALRIPELVFDWPAELNDAAFGIMRDLTAHALNGERGKFQEGRLVFAERFGVWYVLQSVAPDPDNAFPEVGKLLRGLATTPACLRVALVADRRDNGEVLAGGEAGTRALWRKRDGRDVFTGMVALPSPPSQKWLLTEQPCAIAQLVDPEGDILGKCVILSPGEALEAMREYD
jgi:hypothetical protein